MWIEPVASAIWVTPCPSLCEHVLHHTVVEEPSLHSCIREECHNSPVLTPVQRLQYGVTFRGPSHCSSHLPPPRESPPSLQTLVDTAAEIGGVEVEGGGLMSADTPAPSLWDNRASESKLSSVCTAGLREHCCRADLCPCLHMFLSHSLFFTLKYSVEQCIEIQFQRVLGTDYSVRGRRSKSNLHISSKDLNDNLPQ